MKSLLQFLIKIFESKKVVLVVQKPRPMSNPLFKHFKQQHFTAGTRCQFDEKRNKCNPSTMIPAKKQGFSSLFYDIDAYSIDDTFDYIFDKFKKGIFIQIRDNELTVMLPFSKVSYRNEWHPLVKEPSMELLTRSGYKKGYRILSLDRWYANNGLIRYDGYEGESGVAALNDMFTVLCQSRKVPDCEFFVNKRDFPLLRNDRLESYDYMFGSAPLQSHYYEKYAPILSMCTTNDHADIPIPTWDDWGNYSPFPKSAPTPVELVDWSLRKGIALFRGSSSGLGTTIADNPRLKLYSMRDHPLLDIGITKWNIRLRKVKHAPKFDIPQIPWDAQVADFMTYQDQAHYKYIINVDGHSRAYCLTRDLSTGSCILLVESQYKLWYTDRLEAYKHYVPVSADLSDLVDKVKWCLEHDEECRQIGDNGRRFYEQFLSRDAILDYLQETLSTIVQHTGTPLYWINCPAINITKFLYDTPHEQFVEQHLKQPVLEGDTIPLSTWLRSEQFSFHHYHHIQKKVAHILIENQDLKFSHGNLMPEHVLVDRNANVRLKHLTHAHIIVNGIHYGPQHNYTYDILLFKITCMQMILYQKLPKQDIHQAWLLLEELNHFLTYPFPIPNSVRELKHIFKYLRHELWGQLVRRGGNFDPKYVERKKLTHVNHTVDHYVTHLYHFNTLQPTNK
jgi:hypothetical protein